MKNKLKIFVLFVIAVISFSIFPILSMADGNGNAKGQLPKEDIGRIDFIHYTKETKPVKPTTSSCYKLMGVKWNTLPVNYVINPTNSGLTDESFVTGAISTAAETWDAATSQELFNNAFTIDSSAKYGVQNYKNEIAFGPYSQSSVIAVTSIWYSKRTKQIIEFDMLFNTYYKWGENANSSVPIMDLQNIATHELGHAVGLNDIYTTSCSGVTMYGYSDYGDIAKRDLALPDITGLRLMYG
jgi:hypothetical protein